MLVIQSIFETVFQSLPNSLQYNLGEFLWNLNSKRLYFSAKAREKFAKVNGIKISYAELGDPKNPVLVILHGFSDSKESFLSFATHLSKHFFVLIPDLPGFGKSEKPNIHYSLKFYANLLHEFLSLRGISHFHAYGNSMGGAILIEYNHLYFDKFLSLILSCSAGLIPKQDYGSFYEEVKNGKNFFLIEEDHHFEEFMKKIFYNQEIIPFLVKGYIFEEYKTNRFWYEKLMNDILLPHITSSEEETLFQNKKVKEIICPTLILWGEHDKVFPLDLAYEFHQFIPHSKLEIIEDVGHLPHLEKPERTYKRIFKFYKELNIKF